MAPPSAAPQPSDAVQPAAARLDTNMDALASPLRVVARVLVDASAGSWRLADGMILANPPSGLRAAPGATVRLLIDAQGGVRLSALDDQVLDPPARVTLLAGRGDDPGGGTDRAAIDRSYPVSILPDDPREATSLRAELQIRAARAAGADRVGAQETAGVVVASSGESAVIRLHRASATASGRSILRVVGVPVPVGAEVILRIPAPQQGPPASPRALSTASTSSPQPTSLTAQDPLAAASGASDSSVLPAATNLRPSSHVSPAPPGQIRTKLAEGNETHPDTTSNRMDAGGTEGAPGRDAHGRAAGAGFRPSPGFGQNLPLPSRELAAHGSGSMEHQPVRPALVRPLNDVRVSLEAGSTDGLERAVRLRSPTASGMASPRAGSSVAAGAPPTTHGAPGKASAAVEILTGRSASTIALRPAPNDPTAIAAALGAVRALLRGTDDDPVGKADPTAGLDPAEFVGAGTARSDRFGIVAEGPPRAGTAAGPTQPGGPHTTCSPAQTSATVAEGPTSDVRAAQSASGGTAHGDRPASEGAAAEPDRATSAGEPNVTTLLDAASSPGERSSITEREHGGGPNRDEADPRRARFALRLNGLGRVSLEAACSGARFDLVLQTDTSLPVPVLARIRAIHAEALAETGRTGTVWLRPGSGGASRT